MSKSYGELYSLPRKRVTPPCDVARERYVVGFRVPEKGQRPSDGEGRKDANPWRPAGGCRDDRTSSERGEHAMVMTLVSEQVLIERLRRLEPLIRRSGAWAEENCRMHPELFEALSEAQLFSVWKPAALGGLELDPLTGLRIFEEAARIEPAVGWTLANQNGIDTFAGSMLPEAGATEVVSDAA